MAKCISIITPCYNAENYISETMQSVLNQTAVRSGRVELEYIICDGGSEDNTVRLAKELTRGFKGSQVHILSARDSGMYDALAKGLQLAKGDICAYINAGDFYSLQAFDVVLDVFASKQVNWLTGLNVFYNNKSQLVNAILPFKYRNRFFKTGLYGKTLPFVQQESTFWATSLQAGLDFAVLAKMRYAGDFYLWHEFAKVAQLKIVEAYLGGFRMHPGQLSENMAAYYAEMASLITGKANLADLGLAYFDKLMWYAPGRIKQMFNKDGLIRFDHITQDWR